MEAAAKKIGVELKTNELTVIPATVKDGITKPAVLGISFSFTGSENAVKTFLTVLEHIPYHSVLPKITLTGGTTSGEWVGSAQLRLTLRS